MLRLDDMLSCLALVVVYDYFPNSQTLYEAHLKPKAPQFQNGRLQAQNVRLIERTLWSYIIQIAGAIKAVHDAGLAVRVVEVTKILVTSKNRSVLSSRQVRRNPDRQLCSLQSPNQLLRLV